MKRHDRLRFAPIVVLALTGVWACGGSEPPPEPPPPPPATVAPQPPPPPTADVAPAQPPQPDVDFAPGDPATSPDKAPTLKITAPRAQQALTADQAGDFAVKLTLKGWDVPGNGNHVHLIIDDHPYKRIDDPTQPVKLKDIDPNYQLAEGQHVLVAFPSRPTHESVKPIGKASPLAVVPFFVGKKGEVAWKMTDPTLIYSRPKGQNASPPPEGLLVDFYLANVELGDGKYTIDATLTGPGAEGGKHVTIKEWRPYRIKNPRTGTYTLHLILKDKDGKPVPGAWNDVSRDFQVDTSAPAEHHDHGAPGGAPPAGSAPPPAAPH